MAAYIEAPMEYTGDAASLFLAGGITGCPDWHGQIAALIEDLPNTSERNTRRGWPNLVGTEERIVTRRCESFVIARTSTAIGGIYWGSAKQASS